MRTLARIGGRAYLALIYVFILGPAAVVVLASFNSATSFPSPMEKFTLHWYLILPTYEEFLSSTLTSVAVAAIAASVATAGGLGAAYALSRYSFPGRQAVITIFQAPLFVPQIIIGLAVLQLLTMSNLNANFIGIVGVHTVCVLPFALRLILTGMSRYEFQLEEAARSLGANPLRSLWHVTLPMLRTSLVAGFIFCFILSFVDLPLSMFLTTPEIQTLPVTMFAYMESRLDPLLAAVGTIVVVGAALVTYLLDRFIGIRLV